MKTIALSLLLAAFCIAANSQKTVQEWSQMEDKKFFKKMLDGTGVFHLKKFIESEDDLPKLKRVGILGMSIYQPTYSDKNPYSIITPYLTEGGSVFFANMVYNPAIPLMQAEFKKAGIELLTPSEYLDTDAKRAKFDEIEFESSKLMAAVEGISNRVRGGRVDDVKAMPEGYKYLMFVNSDAKKWRAIGEYAGELGLDAVLILETTFGYDGKVLILQRIDAELVGPNPIPYNEDHKKKYAPLGPLKGHLEGLIYGFLGGTSPAGGILLAKLKKGSIKESYEEGIGDVYGRIVRELISRTQGEIDKLIKK